MENKEEIEKAKGRIEDILNCYDEYKKDYEEGHQSSFELDLEDFEVLKTLLQYIDQLEQENEALKKGQASLMASRKKWKDRAYKLRKIFNKQAKMIDVMAKEINEADTGYNDYCNSTKECTGEECENCIKQYFEKKVDERKC